MVATGKDFLPILWDLKEQNNFRLKMKIRCRLIQQSDKIQCSLLF